MSLNWESVTQVATGKEITGSISRIYASAACTLNPTTFGKYKHGPDEVGSGVTHPTGESTTAIAIVAGGYLEGPIWKTKTSAHVTVVYHNGPLIIK